ncbi:MAG: carboxypeptidase-like regulatory domain-containing protein [Acidobacteriaceae bacterium]
MSRSTPKVKFLLLLVCTFCLSILAHAQYRASLRGPVADTQGAVISGAAVTLVNTDTNNTMVTTSDENGIYQFNGLAPAPYKLTAEHEGFKKQELEQVQIIPEQLNSLDLSSA